MEEKTIDFPAGEEFETIEKGTYEATVFAVEEAESGSGNSYLRWTFKIQEKPYLARRVWLNTSLLPQSLWVLANLLENAFGMEVRGKKIKISDILDLVGASCKVVITHRQYEGKVKEEVNNILPSSEAYEAEVVPF